MKGLSELQCILSNIIYSENYAIVTQSAQNLEVEVLSPSTLYDSVRLCMCGHSNY